MSMIGKVAEMISSRPVMTRWILAGPIALVLAIVTMAAMPFWFPAGPAGLDHLAIPILLFPLIWTATVLYPCMDEKLPRAVVVMTALTAMQIAVIISAF
ncbi:MAG: hypothetical protein AAF666_12850 [Pseudomonadota bacterium]